MIEKIEKSLLTSISEYKDQLKLTNPNFTGATNLLDYDDIEKWYLNAKLFESIDTCPPGYTLSYQYAYVVNNEVQGLINIRPKAHEFVSLLQFVGHIGYSVKPSCRNKHVGTLMLKEFLPVIKNDFNLDRVLITCSKDNIASRKIIIANGGVLENILYCPYDECDIERYWIDID